MASTKRREYERRRRQKQKREHKYSPFGFVILGLAVFSLFLFLIGLFLAAWNAGKAGTAIGGIGLISFVISLGNFWIGWQMKKKETLDRIPYLIGMGISGVLFVIYLILIIGGLFI